MLEAEGAVLPTSPGFGRDNRLICRAHCDFAIGQRPTHHQGGLDVNAVTRRPPGPGEWLMLAILATLFSSTFVFNRIALAGLPAWSKSSRDR